MIYFSPFVLLLQLYRRKRIDLSFRFYAMIITVTLVSVLVALTLNNSFILMVTTSIFVLNLISSRGYRLFYIYSQSSNKNKLN